MLVFEILAVGLALLALGGETLLRGAIGLAKVVGLSPLLTGILVVPVCAVAPALFVALQAVGQRLPELAAASIVGANLLYILFALGLAAVIRPIPASPRIVFRDGGVLLLSSLALVLIARAEEVSFTVAGVLLAGFVAYLVVSFITDWRRPAPLSFAESRALARRTAPSFESSVILFVFGLLCLYFGAHYAVESAAVVAHIQGLTQSLVGLTLLSLGICLPGLVAAVSASARGLSNVVAGQLLGTSVFNIVLVLALAAIVGPIVIPRTLADADVFILAAASGVVVSLMLPGWRITRGQGALLLVCYAAYLTFVLWRQGLVHI